MNIRNTVFLFLLFTVSAYANSYAYKPITRIPKADEVTAYTNGKRPPVGERTIIPKEEILRFLSHGTPVREREKWAPTTRSISEFRDGVFFDTSGQAYFWELRARNVLILETADGESIQIILNEN